MKLTAVAVDAALMTTLGPEHPAWANPEKLPEVDGHFVRLDPPLNAPDELLVRMRASVQEGGAAAVKVERTRRDAILHGAELAAEAARPHLSARQVVGEMLGESRSRHKERLEKLIEETLTKEGL
jgi:hypothetical protein